MREKLAGRGEIIVYDGAPHAFFADYRESYREAPAKDAWRRMLAFFETQGVA
jgi:carboxymethylenebutenolidase